MNRKRLATKEENIKNENNNPNINEEYMNIFE